MPFSSMIRDAVELAVINARQSWPRGDEEERLAQSGPRGAKGETKVRMKRETDESDQQRQTFETSIIRRGLSYSLREPKGLSFRYQGTAEPVRAFAKA